MSHLNKMLLNLSGRSFQILWSFPTFKG